MAISLSSFKCYTFWILYVFSSCRRDLRSVSNWRSQQQLWRANLAYRSRCPWHEYRSCTLRVRYIVTIQFTSLNWILKVRLRIDRVNIADYSEFFHVRRSNNAYVDSVAMPSPIRNHFLFGYSSRWDSQSSVDYVKCWLRFHKTLIMTPSNRARETSNGKECVGLDTNKCTPWPVQWKNIEYWFCVLPMSRPTFT